METSQEIGHGMSWERELSTLINGGTSMRNFAKKESVHLVIGLTLQRVKKNKQLPLDN